MLTKLHSVRWVGLAALHVSISCAPAPTQVTMVPTPSWAEGLWSPEPWTAQNDVEVIQFFSTWDFERHMRMHRRTTRARGRFHLEGDTLILEPELFSIDAAHCGGSKERKFKIVFGKSDVRLIEGSKTFRRVQAMSEERGGAQIKL